jgi:hypothetical protein
MTAPRKSTDCPNTAETRKTDGGKGDLFRGNKQRYDEGWDRIFGKLDKTK